MAKALSAANLRCIVAMKSRMPLVACRGRKWMVVFPLLLSVFFFFSRKLRGVAVPRPVTCTRVSDIAHRVHVKCRDPRSLDMHFARAR